MLCAAYRLQRTGDLYGAQSVTEINTLCAAYRLQRTEGGEGRRHAYVFSLLGGSAFARIKSYHVAKKGALKVVLHLHVCCISPAADGRQEEGNSGERQLGQMAAATEQLPALVMTIAERSVMIIDDDDDS